MHILDYLLGLYKKKSQILLLSLVYVSISILSVFIAGLIALIDQSIGVAFLIVPLIAMVALCMNLIMWSIIRSLLDTLCLKFKRKTLNLAVKEPKKRDDASEKRAVREIEDKITKNANKKTSSKLN